MKEIKKTGIFWAIAAVVTCVALFVSMPPSSQDDGEQDYGIGLPMFPDFKDPLVAASLKIATFDETQGELKNFEVRKDSESGQWTIPSKGGYPADAVEQMRDAANSLVDLEVLDVPTINPEDHAGMGVVEPKLEDLNPGDEGVGRMVTFKDEAQKAVASIIIGGDVKGQEGQVYVRKPGQDPVYVVALDDTPLSTKFQDWIEEDLLQLSSIDVEDIEMQDYNVSLGLQGGSITRNYNVSLQKNGTDWTLDELKEYDESDQRAAPKAVEVDPTKQLNTAKLDELVNALDDLKFVDVKRKPEGISANLKTDKDFVTDQQAAAQLMSRGFIPTNGGDGEIEILSANGELTATTKAGVTYILRFGNISGISEGEEADTADEKPEESSVGGVNRYLMVSTVVDDEKFPVPELSPIPQSLEELEAMEKAEREPAESPKGESQLNAPENGDAEATEEAASPAEGEQAEMKEDNAEAGDSDPAEEDTDETSESETDKTDDEKSESTEESKDDGESDSSDESADSESGDTDSGETKAEGEGEATAVGEGQEPADDDGESESADGDAKTDASDEGEAAADAEKDVAKESAEAEQPAQGDAPEMAEEEEVELTEEEKLERLAAVQEKITKENERMLEERKENLEKAGIQSKMLNERFADWYYVIPEDTYSKLRISREDLFQAPGAAGGMNPAGMPPGMPGLGMPGQGFPPGFPGN